MRFYNYRAMFIFKMTKDVFYEYIRFLYFKDIRDSVEISLKIMKNMVNVWGIRIGGIYRFKGVIKSDNTAHLCMPAYSCGMRKNITPGGRRALINSKFISFRILPLARPNGLVSILLPGGLFNLLLR